MSRTFPHEDSQSPEPSDEEEEEEQLLVDEQDQIHGEDEDDGEEDGDAADRDCVPPPPPPGLKEISSLASWTVSSSKPGCGIPALRSPSTSQFWQSDGPQPHHLNIHFFKLVEIVGMRIYLDFERDESYTPTMIRFAAGMGYVDLQEFAVMRFEQPKGWMEVDFEGVGEAAEEPGVTDENEEGMDVDSEEEKENSLRKMPVLRCMLVQVRICENHQNGKDTHLRGLQIFARDGVRREQRVGVGSMSKEKFAVRKEGLNGLLNGGTKNLKKKVWDLDMPEWTTVPALR